MFNKPGVFGRNEPITRRDARPILGSGTAANTAAAPAADPAAKEVPQNATGPQSAAAPDAPPPSPAKASAESANDNVMGARLIVGPDVKLKGAEILDCDTLVVEGRVEATMDSRVIRIADAGSFSGKVSIDIAEIHGTFEGELTARHQLIVHATGRVSGKIRYGKLVVEEGGQLSGEIDVGTTVRAASKPRPVDAVAAVA